MDNNSVQISQIKESLDVEYTAFCNGCGCEIRSDDAKKLSEKSHENGWRVNAIGDLLCQSCIKKHP